MRLKVIKFLVVLPSAELFQHDHFVATVFGRLGKEHLLFLVLCRVDNVCPLLLILALKVAQELIERLVTLCHRPNARIQRLSLRLLLTFDELLKFFDF